MKKKTEINPEHKMIESLGLKLNLTKSEIGALIHVITEIRSYWLQTKFRLFGSKASGTSDSESDLDLLIEIPGKITESIRKDIIHLIFDINLEYNTNISAMIVSEAEWESPPYSLLPIYSYIQEEGVSL